MSKLVNHKNECRLTDWKKRGADFCAPNIIHLQININSSFFLYFLLPMFIMFNLLRHQATSISPCWAEVVPPMKTGRAPSLAPLETLKNARDAVQSTSLEPPKSHKQWKARPMYPHLTTFRPMQLKKQLRIKMLKRNMQCMQAALAELRN